MLLFQHLSHVRIVMVNTTLPANIGSALRAMKTMGLCKLVLVAPKPTHIRTLMPSCRCNRSDRAD